MNEQNVVEGRIRFPGNPWPNGHRILSCAWVGAITPLLRPGTIETYDPCLSIGFVLKTADYDEDDSESFDAVDDDGADVEDWTAKIVWNNYHACWIGPSQTSNRSGIVVSDGTVPFDFERPDYSFTADPLPVDWNSFFAEQAFGVYLLGHDAVADHTIRLHRRQSDGSYTLDWRGRIALAYAGQQEFRYGFEAHASGVRLDAISLYAFDRMRAKEHYGIDIDPHLTARDYIAPFVANPDRFTFERRHGTLYAVPMR